MAIQLFTNNAVSTLAAPINDSTTSMEVAAGDGVLYPNPGANQYFLITISDLATGELNEIVKVTARSGDTMTIVRGQEGTAAREWNAGDPTISMWTAGSAGAMLQQGQYQQQSANYAVDSGSVNALAVTLSPAPTALSALIGAPIRVKVAHTNDSGSVTLNVNSLGAVAVKTLSIANPGIGSIPANGICEFAYDGTQFQYLGTIPSSGAGTVTSVATNASLTGGPITGSGTLAVAPASALQVQTGTDNIQAITSAALRGAMAMSLGQTGYQKLPSGLIIQWGRTSTPTGLADVFFFPLAMASHCTLASNSGYVGSGDPFLLNLSISGPPYTQFTAWSWRITAAGPVIASTGFGWVAIGF